MLNPGSSFKAQLRRRMLEGNGIKAGPSSDCARRDKAPRVRVKTIERTAKLIRCNRFIELLRHVHCDLTRLESCHIFPATQNGFACADHSARPTYSPIGEMIGLEWPRRLRYAIHENFCRYISRFV